MTDARRFGNFTAKQFILSEAQMNLEKINFSLTALSMVALTGCVLHGTPDRNSRYSADISTMQREELSDFPHTTWVFRHPTRKPTDFAKFILAPMTVYEKPASAVLGRDRETFDVEAGQLRLKLAKLIGKDYFLTEKSGPDTMRIEVQIVDIKPVVQMKKDGNDTTILNPNIKGSKIEANCYDSATNELIYAISTLYKGDEYTAYQDASLLPNMEKAFDEWAVYFKRRFDTAMALPGMPVPTPTPRKEKAAAPKKKTTPAR